MPMHAKMLVIVNPIAGAKRAAKLWPLIQERLTAHGIVHDCALTEAPLHAVRLASDAVQADYTSIVSVGGDGTLNEIVNGLMTAPAKREVTIGVIPVGTGTDYVRTLGLPRTWQEACDHLQTDNTRLVDLGEAIYVGAAGEEHRFFVNVAGLGFDGEVAARVNRSSKRLGGTIPYLTNLVMTLVSYANKDVQLRMGERDLAGRMNSVVVANGQWFGGGMWVAPNARPDDGIFDIVMVGDVGKIELLQTMPRLYKGTHLTHPKVKVEQASEVHVVSKQDMWLQADGEALGRAPATFRILPLAMRLHI